MVKYTAATNDKKNRATTQYTGATLDGTGTMTNNGNGLFRSDLNNPIIKTQYTGATLDGKGTITNPSTTFANQINLGNTIGDVATKAVANASPATVTNPYADLYSIYENQLNAQKAAAEQQRQARLGALQSNYANAKNQLSSAFDSGEQQINTDSDKALREAYINMMLDQRRLNQQLQSQGVNGGALESTLARAYNDYGGNRNSIEQGRLDNISQLLREYQNSLGDVETNYQNNLANLDADYSGNIADAVNNYYQTIANLQAQNAASSLKNALGKSGSSSKSGNTTDETTKAIVNVLKNFRNSPSSAKTYLASRGIVGAEADDLLWQSGIDPTLLGSLEDTVANTPGNTMSNTLSNTSNALSSDVVNYILNEIGREGSKPGTSEAYRWSLINNRMQQLAKQYGLTEEQARALLEEAGY